MARLPPRRAFRRASLRSGRDTRGARGGKRPNGRDPGHRRAPWAGGARRSAGSALTIVRWRRRLAAGSDPVDVARGYAALFPFPTLYVADLDGIEGAGRNERLAGASRRRSARHAPLDRRWHACARCGAAHCRCEARDAGHRHREPRRRADDVAALRALPPDRYVLSLDFKDDRFDGPSGGTRGAAALAATRVIVMTLARVGTGEGPDLQRIAAIVGARGRPAHLRGRRRAPPRRHRSAARGRRRRRARRHGAARRNDKGRRSPGDRRPLMSSHEGSEQNRAPGVLPVPTAGK